MTERIDSSDKIAKIEELMDESDRITAKRLAREFGLPDKLSNLLKEALKSGGVKLPDKAVAAMKNRKNVRPKTCEALEKRFLEYLRDTEGVEQIIKDYRPLAYLLPTMYDFIYGDGEDEFITPHCQNLDEDIHELDEEIESDCMIINYPELHSLYCAKKTRTAAIIATMCESGGVDFLKNKFAENLYADLTDDDAKIPANLRLIVPKEKREMIHETHREAVKMSQDPNRKDPFEEAREKKRIEMISSGVHEKMAEHIMEAVDEKFLSGIISSGNITVENIYRLLKEYPDPRVFVDRIIYPNGKEI